MSRKLYGAAAEQVVTSVTGVIRPDGAGNVTAFDGNVFLAAMQSQLNPNKTLKYIRVIKYNYTTYWNFVLDYYYTDMSSFNLVNHGSAADVAVYGVTVTDTLGGGQDLIDLTQTVGPSGRYLTAQVNKLYGGVKRMTGATVTCSTNYVYDSIDTDVMIDHVNKLVTDGSELTTIWMDVNSTGRYRGQYALDGFAAGDIVYWRPYEEAKEKFAEWGITLRDESTITLPPSGTYTPYTDTLSVQGTYGNCATSVKLYGSANGQAKLVHQERNHLEYGNVSKFGNVVYYTGVVDGYGLGPDSYNIYTDWINIDQTGAAQFISDYNVKVTNHTATLWANNGDWTFQDTNDVWQTINSYVLESQYDVRVYPTDYSNARFDLVDNVPVDADTTSPTATTTLLSQSEVDSLAGNYDGMPSKAVTVGNNSLIIGQIKEITTGYDVSSIPSYFLSGSNADTIDISKSPIKTVPSSFAANTPVTSLSLPKGEFTIGSDFLYECASFNAPLDLRMVSSIEENFMSSCTSFNQKIKLSDSLAKIPDHFLDGCTSYNQPIDIPNVTQIGISFLHGCSSFNHDVRVPETVTRIWPYFMYRCNAMTSTVYWNCPPHDTQAEGEMKYNNATNDQTAACYTTGVTYGGMYGAAWAVFNYNNSASSPYRNILCADGSEQYGVVYHYPHTTGWAQGSMLQNVTWEITNSSQLSQFSSQIGYTTSSTEQIYFVYQSGQWVCWFNGNSTQITDFPNQVGITVTSTHGGFQENDGFSIFWGARVNTDGDIIRTVMVSGDINRMVNSAVSNTTPKTYSVGGITVCDQAILFVSVGTTNTSLPNYFLSNCIRLRAVAINDSVTSIGSSVMRNTFDYDASIIGVGLTSIGDNFMNQANFQYWSPYPEIKFNSDIYLPNVTSIGTRFLSDNSKFNQGFSLGKIVSIGNYFLANCTKYNSQLSLGSTLTTLGTYFLYNCNSMTNYVYVSSSASGSGIASSNYSFATTNSSAACYTTGIRISGGTYTSSWTTKFPNRTSSPYRKLRT